MSTPEPIRTTDFNQPCMMQSVGEFIRKTNKKIFSRTSNLSLDAPHRCPSKLDEQMFSRPEQLTICREPLQKMRVRLGACKTGLSPQ